MKYSIVKPIPVALSLSTAISLVLFSATDVLAQERARQIEEVVVTAQRREATEQTTSISMEVLTGEDIAQQGIRNIRDMQMAVPGIQIQNSGLDNDINIRGIGNNATSPDVQMGVQLINDGFTQGEPRGNNSTWFDVGTIEVLRGPQGTFVGQSAAGGAILVNSAEPNFDGVNGYIEGTTGNYKRARITGAINLPMTDTIAGRIAFNTDSRNSFYKNEGANLTMYGTPLWQPGSVEDRQYRLSLLWQPTSNFEALARVENNRVEHQGNVEKPNPGLLQGVIVGDHDNNPATPVQPFPIMVKSRYVDEVPTDPFTISETFPSSDMQQNQQWTLDLSYEFANGNTLASTTAYNRIHIRDWGNSTFGLPVMPRIYELGPDNRSTSQEITLASPDGRTNWIVGAFAQTRTTPFGFYGGDTSPADCGWGIYGTGTLAALGDPLEIVEVDGGQSQYGYQDCDNQMLIHPTHLNYSHHKTDFENYSVFGQYNYAINEEWQIEAGARMNYDNSQRTTWRATSSPLPIGSIVDGVELTVPCTHYGITGGFYDDDQWNCGAGSTSVNAIENFDVDQTVPTWKIGVNYEPFDNQYFYAFWARGYKAATTRGGGSDPEEVDDIEFGWKGDLFDGLLSGDLGFYRMDYTNIQGSRFYADDPLGAGNQAANIGEAIIQGLEGSFRAFIGNLGINGAFSWIDSEMGSMTTVNEDFLPSWAEHPAGGEFDFLPQCGITPALSNESTGNIIDPVTNASVPNGNCFDYADYIINLSGQHQIHAPELSYNLSVDYQFVLPMGTLTPEVRYSHTDASWDSLIQSDANASQNDERDLMSLSLTFDTASWSVQAFMDNATDEVYVSAAQGDTVRYGAPRTYGIRARMTF